jgi:excisionase family DNA binding protein
MPDLTEALLTLDEAAELIAVSKISLRRWTKNGTVNCVRVGSRGDRRFLRKDLETYVSARSYESSSNPDVKNPTQSR